jgi:hypothetical protein
MPLENLNKNFVVFQKRKVDANIYTEKVEEKYQHENCYPK